MVAMSQKLSLTQIPQAVPWALTPDSLPPLRKSDAQGQRADTLTQHLLRPRKKMVQFSKPQPTDSEFLQAPYLGTYDVSLSG